MRNKSYSRACKFGYTWGEISDMLGKTNMPKFEDWFRGQTGAICDGRQYNHDTESYEETGCGPHGGVVYAHDLTRFIYGQQPFD